MMRLFGAFIIALFLVSCGTQRILHSNKQQDGLHLLMNDSSSAHVLRYNDKISVSIWGNDDYSVGSVYSIYNANEAYGKWLLIDENGQAALPKFGNVTLAGLTVYQASKKIEKLYATQINKPVVVLKVLNRKAHIYGEVKSTGAYDLEKEITPLSDLISMSEGFTDYANTSKISLVRDSVSYRIDMSRLTPAMLHHINIKADDIVIVPAKRGKTIDKKAPTLIPFSSAISAVILILTLFNNN